MYNFLKRIIDLIVSLFITVLFMPIMVSVALIIKIDSKGPILFKQERVGKNDTRFTIYKFRSMSTETPSDLPTHLLKDADNHITNLGKFLRKSSLDELPQLFNIIKGEMSFVGPRPSLPNQIDLNRLRSENGSMSLKPGLTGLAQIKGRDELPIPEKAKLDAEYYQKRSLRYDTYLFFATFGAVFNSKGVKEGYSNDSHAKFK